MAALLYNALQHHIKGNVYPFHMPGHKGKYLNLENMLQMDITEIPGFDNLHNPGGIILTAQKMAAKTFGADESFFLVNGSTGGIIAAILSAVSDGETIIIARNSHRSTYTGINFSGAAPFYVFPDIIQSCGINGSISPENIEYAFEQNKNAKAAIITSPTYEGITSNIEEIAQIAHRHNAVLIVDEAHGAHFKFHKSFPKTALDSGADIVIQSLHKTLPSLTQTAILHVKGNRINIKNIQKMLSLTQTTSPSYILLASIDLCRDLIDRNGNVLFEKYVSNLSYIQKNIEGLKNIKLLNKSNNHQIYDFDISKLTFTVKKMTGFEIEKILLKKYNIQIEMSGLSHFVSLTTVCDDKDGFIRLCNALDNIDMEIDDNPSLFYNYINFPKPIIKLTPKKALGLKMKTVSLIDSLGKISTDFIIPYPPGIPVVVPGEVITEQILNNLIAYREYGIPVIGISSDEKITIGENI